MQKTILITGSTDGIGLETAKALYSQGHHLLIHGRSAAKLQAAEKAITQAGGGGEIESYLADLSSRDQVEALARAISKRHERLDVVINNAGVFRTPDSGEDHGLDIRFVVNTLAPYLLTQRLLPQLGSGARVVNLSSAAQSTVNLEALTGRAKIPDQLSAYAQSKLAITMWTNYMAQAQKDKTLVFVSVNPGSLLATKMVKEGFGTAGKDIHIGSDILIRAALSDEFAEASGKYYDNDAGRFSAPHPDALDSAKCEAVVRVVERALASGWN